MTMYLGDYAAGETVHFMWNTNGADGASITRATDGTISVYKDDNNTQTTTGVSGAEDVESLTGVHRCVIATTDAFYTTGTDYMVVLSGAVIDGKTINAVLAHFSIENRAAYLKAAAVEVDTQDLQSRTPAALVSGRMDTSVGAMAANVITAAAMAADVITDIWQGTALTEAYAADGAAATPAQLLYLILAALTEFSISGTTITVKKLDGSTTAATYTLNDGTNPTSRTRAS